MLLPIRRLTCAKDLWAATKLAGSILNYAAAYNGTGFDSDDFKVKLQQGEWLLKRPKKVREAIEDLLSLTPAERRVLQTSFWNDVGYMRNINSPEFEFFCHASKRKVSDTALTALEKLMVSFYKEILGGRGFDIPGTNERLTTETVERSYREANSRRQMLCPACLGELPPPARGRSRVDREHYFPKSKYPALAVHPSNLPLACKSCNQALHLEEDPINTPNQGMGELRTIFLPYKRSGLHEVGLRFHQRPNSPLYNLELYCKSTNQFSQDRLDQYERVYGLTEQWGKKLVSMHDELATRVYCHLGTPTIEQADKFLEAEFKKSARLMLEYPGAFLEMQFIAWLRQPRELKAFAEECANWHNFHGVHVASALREMI